MRSFALQKLSLLVAVCLSLPLPGQPASARADVLAPEVRQALAVPGVGQAIDVIVHLAQRADLAGTDARQVAPELRRQAAVSQAPIREWLRAQQSQGRVADVVPFWIFNGLAVTASADAIRELAERRDVARITLNQFVSVAHRAQSMLVSADEIGHNLRAIRAPDAWGRGITGQGVVVALLDSGVDMSHPELAARWRGGTNSWFDPYGDFPDQPGDLDGHGTQTLGVILGGEDSGAPIGIAPDARWIAAKIFDRRGRATVANIHKALQWIIDPDGDPATDDAPHIVNNSWSLANPGCVDEFSEDLRALRAAGILPVFAAGVRGSVSPANTLEAFAVGSLADNGQTRHFDSPQGPSACEDVPVFPRVVAPGDDVRTTDRFGYYTVVDGTSVAAAHASGALALLLQADPNLTPDEQAAILVETAVDLGEPGPDTQFGYGRIDVAAALERILGPDPARLVLAEAAEQPSGAVAWISAIGVASAALVFSGLLVRSKRRRSGSGHG